MRVRHFLLFFSCISALVAADEKTSPYKYRINPGDVVSIHVWNEADLSKEQILVRPDGCISLPIVGEVDIAGKSIVEAEQEISERLSSYVRDKPMVAITTVALNGNSVFVLGKVARPGQFTIYGHMDVAQALALAGGTTTFADSGNIKILRRDKAGNQQAIRFDYKKIEEGKDLKGNIYIESGDVVVVP